MRALSLILAALCLAACGGERAPADADAGVSPDGGESDAFVTAPAPPMVSCPPGWSVVAVPDGPTFCEPWPEGTDTRCPAGQARFVDGEACEVVGPPCPAGEFAEDLTGDLPAGASVIHISPSAPLSGSDGTREHPFPQLGPAFAAASPGDIFALGKGRHVINALFPDDVTFIGACAAETELVAGFSDGATGTVTAVEQGHVLLRNVTIIGEQPGLRVEEQATLEVSDVIIRGSGLAGVFVLDGTFVADNLVVRDTVPVGGEFGRALQVMEGGSAEIRRAVFERVHDIAVQVLDPGSSASLSDFAIRDVVPDEAQGLGRGIEVNGGASATIERGIIENARNEGLFVGGGNVTLTDVLVRRIREGSADTFGRGLHVEAAGRLVGERVTVDDCRELGVYGSGEGSELEFRDLVVRRTRPRASDGAGGRGIQLQWGITATLERVRIDENVEFGMMVATEGTNVTVRDAHVSRTLMHPMTEFGRGIEVLLGGHLDLERVRVEDSVEIGFYVSESVATVRDFAVVGTKPQPVTGWYGRGIVVVGEVASLSGERVHVAQNTEIGVFLDTGSLSLTATRIEDTQAQPCLLDCMGRTAGVGLFVIDDGVATLEDFLIADNALAGLILIDGGRAPLNNGEIARNPVAVYASGQASDAALADLTDVALTDNARNFDGSIVPVPEPSVPGRIDL